MKKYLLALSLLGVFASFTQQANAACEKDSDCKAGEYCDENGQCQIKYTR